MKYLITGGSGFLGINLIRFLLEKEKDCEITSLDIRKFNYPEKTKIHPLLGDIRSKFDLDAALSNKPDFVIHCAAALPLYSKEEIFSTDVDGTKLVLERSFNKKVKKVIFISSSAVYAEQNGVLSVETDKLLGRNFYSEAKILAEQICFDYQKRGYCVPVLRPKTFIGEERLGTFAILYKWAREGYNFPLIGDGKNKYQFLDVEDLCDVIYSIILNNSSEANDVFNVAAKEFSTMQEDYQAVLDLAGFGKKIKPFPASIAIFGLSILSKLHLSPIYPWIYETAGKDSIISIEKAEKILGFSPKFSNKEALEKNFKWYLLHYKEYENLSGVSNSVPWKDGALDVIKKFYK